MKKKFQGKNIPLKQKLVEKEMIETHSTRDNDSGHEIQCFHKRRISILQTKYRTEFIHFTKNLPPQSEMKKKRKKN